MIGKNNQCFRSKILKYRYSLKRFIPQIYMLKIYLVHSFKNILKSILNKTIFNANQFSRLFVFVVLSNNKIEKRYCIKLNIMLQ